MRIFWLLRNTKHETGMKRMKTVDFEIRASETGRLVGHTCRDSVTAIAKKWC